jgi:methylase of polypeptide subunit release factors
LIVELSPMLAQRVEQWFAQQARWKLERIIKDLAGHPRIAVAKLLSKE